LFSVAAIGTAEDIGSSLILNDGRSQVDRRAPAADDLDARSGETPSFLERSTQVPGSNPRVTF
jgi:hypothetical protein